MIDVKEARMERTLRRIDTTVEALKAIRVLLTSGADEVAKCQASEWSLFLALQDLLAFRTSTGDQVTLDGFDKWFELLLLQLEKTLPECDCNYPQYGADGAIKRLYDNMSHLGENMLDLRERFATLVVMCRDLSGDLEWEYYLRSIIRDKTRTHLKCGPQHDEKTADLLAACYGLKGDWRD